MATGTVYLDVDDEITSAAARIRGSEATKVALVIPYGSRISTSRMNFRLLSREAEALAALESRDTGKPLRQGKADVAAAVRYFEFYGGAADKIHGDTLPFLDGYTALTLREPHGVVAGIIPWNYPLQILSRVAGAALAMGNTLVIKPAEDASLTTIRMAELALEAGFPHGVFNVVTGYGREAGAALAAHPQVDFITFTGSPATGTAIQQAAALNHHGVTLELGGKSPQLVFADADLEAALPVLVAAAIQNGGQTCSAGSRVLIERPVYDAVAKSLAERFGRLVAGPHDADLDLGPLISPRQKERVASLVGAAQAAGTPLLATGRISAKAPAGGYYQAPLLFGPVHRRPATIAGGGSSGGGRSLPSPSPQADRMIDRTSAAPRLGRR